MVLMGYRLAAEVYAFTSVPKYGAATFVLYRAAFALLGPGHDTLAWVHVACGSLSVLLLAGLLARRRPPVGAALVTTALYALLPIFLRDHRSESILVPTMLCTWASLLGWDRWWRLRSGLDLSAAVVFAALAMSSRPEMLAIMPLLLWVWTPAERAPLARGGSGLLGLAAAALALAVTPQVWLVTGAVLEMRTSGALPGADGAPWLLVAKAGRVVIGRNVLLTPLVFPLAATLLALYGAFTVPPAQRRFVRTLLVVCALWMASFFVDLPEVSVPRLGAPVAALACVPVGVTLASLHAQRGRRVAGLAAALIVLSAMPTAFALWAPTNEDEEETFLRDAIALLPPEPVCFVRIDTNDPPPHHKAHRYFPDYLLRPPNRRDRVFGMTAWTHGRPSEPDACPGGAYAVQSLQCYIDFEGPDERPTEPDGGAQPHASCRAFRERFGGEVLLERALPNHGDNEFGYYPDNASHFDAALYRLR